MGEPSDTWDGILLGAGHNALVLQAYLGKAGLKTLCLERSATPGGGLATVEDPRHPGFLHNTHSFFHRAITGMPRYRDLELERHGAKYLEPELNVALAQREGDLLVGAFTNGQVGCDRPFPGAGHYRGRVRGLYLCGSCCHPGGNVTGPPGYNCAQVLHADLGLPAPSAPQRMQ